MGETILNEAQMAAVSHRNGPALVLAGPGSGKTTVITHRSLAVAKEIERPSRLLSVTFTRAAGLEMAGRYCRLAGIEHPKPGDIPVYQTVHAFCNGVIGIYERETGRHFTRIEGEGGGKMQILSTLYHRYNNKAPDGPTLKVLESAASRRITDDRIPNESKILQAYAAYKRENDFLDFEDMISVCLEILKTHPDFCARMAAQFDYVQVDEGQDLSREQYEVIRLIAPHKNLLIVADDDQSIYRFRGAEPSCIFDFVKQYPDCTRYNLTQNYRSTKRIVEAASIVVSRNQKRFDKDLYTMRSEGTPVKVRRFSGCGDQAKYICDVLAKAGGAVLYRNGVSSLTVRLALTLQGIPYEIRGGYERVGNIQVVGSILQEILQAERNARFLLPSPAKTYKRMVQNGYIERLRREYAISREHQRYLSAVLEFISLLVASCDSWRSCVEILGKMDQNNTAATVILTTIHSAKGLEFDTVCMIDLVEGEFPGSGATAGEDLEEERRLFYVGMTRAKETLYLCSPLARGGLKEVESRFVRELDKNWRKKDKIS